MNTRTPIASLAIAAGCAAPALAQDGPPVFDPILRAAWKRIFPAAQDAGADVITGELHSSQSSNNSMTLTINPSGSTATHVAYGIGTTSCNVGTTTLNWVPNTPNHPVIPQNLYRLTPGTDSRFVQLGQSWCKFTLATLLFSNCSNEMFFCNNPMNALVLGIGCSDVYAAAQNAAQSSLGPRFTVNPFTGDFPDGDSAWRAANWLPAPSSGMDRRLRIAKADLDAGGLYFAEAAHVARDDALAGNGKNNVSYRRATFAAATYVLTFVDSTVRRAPAIHAWRDHGLGLGVPDPTIMISEVNSLGSSPPDGWFVVGSHAVQTGPSTWHYEYAVENINSDRMGGSFSIPLAAGTTASNAAWRGVDSHSGIPGEDATRNEPWTFTTGTSITFRATTPFNAAFPLLGNGLRWGTMYNFSFDCNKPPVTGQVSLGFYKPGSPASIAAGAWIPNQTVPTCYANCDGSSGMPLLTPNDFQCFLDLYAAGAPGANCDASTGSPTLTPNDFQCFLDAYAAGCP